MPTFSIENFGCRATDADASAIRSALVADGLTPATEHAAADVVVLNTCTVTAAADSQAREAVRKIHHANPSARIVVTGCYAQRAPEEIAAIEGVEWVVGNSHQAKIVEILRDAGPRALRNDFVSVAALKDDPLSLARGPAKILTGDIFAQSTVQIVQADQIAQDRTRPILKIQDGCNNRCSYCVIPFVRGKSRSLPPDEVIRETRAHCEAGAKEIVLSGINLGSYGRDLTPRADLAAVVRRILDETALDQLRFSSIEPQDVTEDFVALVASSARIARHFHIPLQSGCDRVLRAMHRWYRTCALRGTRAPDPTPAARRGHRRRRDCRLPRRNRSRFPRDPRLHRAPALHVSARILIFRASRHRRSPTRRARSSPDGSRTRPRTARIKPTQGRRIPRRAIRPARTRANVGPRRQHAHGSSHGKLSEGENPRPPPSQRMARSSSVARAFRPRFSTCLWFYAVILSGASGRFCISSRNRRISLRLTAPLAPTLRKSPAPAPNSRCA